MNYLIISSHPYDGSFNGAEVNLIKETAMAKGYNIRHIDLVRENFDPVMHGEDLRLWRTGESNNPQVAEYKKAIEDADVLVFPFPVWWGTMPAVLKGFLDKVFLPGWAYKYDENGEMVGLLDNKKAIVITTMQTPVEIFKGYFNDPVEGSFIKDTLQACGIEILNFLQIDRIVTSGKEYSEEKLKEIKALIK